MKNNVRKVDKIIRIIVGLAIGAIVYYFKSLLGLIGIAPIFTAFIKLVSLIYRFG